jgi:hypothetical protein
VYPPLSSIRNISLEIAVKVTSASTGILLFIVALPAHYYIASDKMAIKAYVAVRVTSCVSFSCAISRIPVYNVTSNRVIASHDRVKSGKSVKSRISSTSLSLSLLLIVTGRAGPGRAGVCAWVQVAEHFHKVGAATAARPADMRAHVAGLMYSPFDAPK